MENCGAAGRHSLEIAPSGFDSRTARRDLVEAICGRLGRTPRQLLHQTVAYETGAKNFEDVDAHEAKGADVEAYLYL